jgi:photosystem II stability/assembly factor-like uncharacterized protein
MKRKNVFSTRNKKTNTQRMKKSAILAASLMLLLGLGCKKDKPDPQNPGAATVVVVESAHLLDTVDLKQLEVVDTATYDLKFTNWPADQPAPKTGEVVTGCITESTPYGLLRKITKVTQADGGYILATEPAKLDEVILEGEITVEDKKITPDMVKTITTEPGVVFNELKSTNLVGFDFSFEKKLADGVTVYGSAFFDLSFNFSLDIDVAPPDLYIKSSIEVDQRGSIGVKAKGSWSAKRIKIAEIEFVPWTIMVGPVPVVFVPRVALILDAEAGNVSYEVVSFASESINSELGIEYKDDDWHLINECNPSHTINYPEITGNADFTVKCGPEVSLKLYNAAGPYFNILAYSTLKAETINDNYDLNFILGLEANAGLQVEVFGFINEDVSYQLFDKEITRLTLNDKPVPNSIQLTMPIDGSNLIVGREQPVTVSVNGKVEGGVNLYLDNNLITKIDKAPYTYNWKVDAAEGVHTLKAEAQIGETLMSSTVSVNVGRIAFNELTTTGFKEDDVIYSMYFSSPKSGIAVGYRDVFFGDKYGFVVFTSDGGITWTGREELENGFDGFSDVIVMHDTVYVCGYSYGLLKLEGNDFVPKKDRYGENVSATLLRSTSDGVFVKANGTDIGVSTDGIFFLESYNEEISIEPSLQPTNSNIADMAFGSGGCGYFVANEWDRSTYSVAYKTIDDGMNWKPITRPGKAGKFHANAIEAMTDSLVWVAGKNLDNAAQLFYSTDAGSTWKQAKLPDYYNGVFADLIEINDIDFVDPYTGYAVGIFGGFIKTSSILTTIDGGKTWTTLDIPITQPIYNLKKVCFYDAYNGWAGGFSSVNGNPSDKKKTALFRFSKQ